MTEAHEQFCIQSNFFFCTMEDEDKSQEICTKAFDYNPHYFKHIPHKFLTPNLCRKAIEYDISNMFHIPIKNKTEELCNYAANIRIELILNEDGVPLSFRKQWMYDLLLDKQLFYIAHIPEIYIPISLLKLPSKFINLELSKSRGKSRRLNCTMSKLLHRCVTKVTETYRKHIDDNMNIKNELMIYAWALYHVRDWCADIDTQKRISLSFLL